MNGNLLVVVGLSDGAKPAERPVTLTLTMDSVDDSEILDMVAYVTSSNYRELVLSELKDGPKQPSQIASSGDVAPSHVSRALTELENKGLVTSHGENTRATLYTLTEVGERVNQLRSSTDSE